MRDEKPSWLATVGRTSLSQNDSIIILDLNKKDYIFLKFYDAWTTFPDTRICPTCGCEDQLRRHARYTKHYYGEQLWILRVRCRNCGTTHAIIPSFSLPDTSIGTVEVEEYLNKRSKRIGRGTAGKKLLDLLISEKHLRNLDLMFQVYVDRAKALFPDAGKVDLDGMEWVGSVVGDTSRPLYALNRYCLKHGVNPVCCSRASILLFSASKAGRRYSRNLVTFQKSPATVHSP